jgi:LmbE family N-acetylglucosaminyl deacetylase
MKILVIGAHPDDIELGCGGTINLYNSNNHPVYGLILSNGERSGDPVIRKQETVDSLNALGVKRLFFGELPDTKIGNDISTISVIENIVNKLKPDIIFTHSINEIHQDHRNTALSTFSAARNVPTILCYESPSLMLDFKPQCYYDIIKTIDQKIEALKLHKSQIDKRYFKIDAILGLSKYRGNQMNLKYAESFEVFKMLNFV